MNDLERINNDIDNNRWRELADFLANKHGCIGPCGGRYIANSINSRDDNLAVINRICWKIFQVSCENQFEEVSKTEKEAAGEVFRELKRIYDESSIELYRIDFCSGLPTILSTWAYDACERFPDGLTSIQRLEMCAVFDLKKEQ